MSTTKTGTERTPDIAEFDKQIKRLETEIGQLEKESAALADCYLTAATEGNGPELTRIANRKQELPAELRAAQVRLLTIKIQRGEAQLAPAIMEARRLAEITKESAGRLAAMEKEHIQHQRAAAHATVRTGSIRTRIQGFTRERERLSSELVDLGRLPGTRRPAA